MLKLIREKKFLKKFEYEYMKFSRVTKHAAGKNGITHKDIALEVARRALK